MRLLLTVKLLLVATFTYAQRCKTITPGEHSGYKLEYYNEKNIPVEITLKPGESWMAIYVKNGYFSAKPEVLTWKEKGALTVASNGVEQPLFYVQGLQSLKQSGACTAFEGYKLGEPPQLKSWSYQNKLYAITYSRDRVTKKLAAYQYGTIQFDEQLTVFKGVEPKVLQQVKNQVQHLVQLA